MDNNPAPAAGLRFHHVGCAVRDIREAVESHRLLALNMGEVIRVSAQGVNVCFIEVAPQSYLEFVEPATEDSAVGGLLKKFVHYYHLGFLAGDFDRAIAILLAANYRQMNLFRSEAFGMRRCSFLSSPASNLIEIIETA